MATREHWEVDDWQEVLLRVIGASEEDDTKTYRAVCKILEGVDDGKKCLEIGAGYGRLVLHMGKHFESSIGVDSSKSLVALSAHRLRNSPNCSVVLTDGEYLPYPDNTFDFVYSFTCFQHMMDISTIRNNIREAYRVLTPDGICRIQTVCENPEWYHDGRIFGSISEFANEFFDAGFDSVKGSVDEENGNWIWVTARKG